MEAPLLTEPCLKARERLPVDIYTDSETISSVVAKEIASLVKERASQGERSGFLLRLPSDQGLLARLRQHSLG